MSSLSSVRRRPADLRPRAPRSACVLLAAMLALLAAAPAAPAQRVSGSVTTAEERGRPGYLVDPPRGASARAVAVRIAARPRIDGVLDEAFWDSIPPVTEFVQRDPLDGGIPSERTEMRIAYDEENLYFGLTLHDSDPAAIRASNLHRGGKNGYDDHVVIGLDTFNDRRNGYIFEMNSLGVQDDALYTDETIQDWNWDGVYTSEARITEEGWVLEVAIPFTTIRFPREQVLDMGLLVYRSIRRKNETVFWPHLPATYRGRYAQASQYGTLTGLRGITPGRNLQIKPYLLGGGQKAGPGAAGRSELDAGLDLKYGITSSLTLDLTYNTDFAQVEADHVQVNLDRFSLFYPEKREFFLERSGLFTFGDPGRTQLFFSRRIGLENPIVGGGRLTGQVGRFSVGLLNLQTGGSEAGPGANNGVARVRADLGPRATVGGLLTSLQRPDGSGRSAGVDAQVRFLGSSSVDVWAARVWDPALAEGRGGPASDRGPAGGLGAGAANLRLSTTTYGAAIGYTSIGRDFLPALGFVRRLDQVRWTGEIGVTPRFERSGWARELQLFAREERIDGQDGVLQSERRSLDGQLNLRRGDGVGLSLTRSFERLDSPFRIRDDAVLSVGDYAFSAVTASARTNPSRPVSGTAGLSLGEFYSGTRSEVRGTLGLTVSRHLILGAGVVHNVVSLPVENGGFTATVLDLTVKAAVNRYVLADALIQYDDVSRRVQGNVRLNWLHTPGSNLFLVLESGYNTGPLLDPRDVRWERRTGVAKLTYLWAI